MLLLLLKSVFTTFSETLAAKNIYNGGRPHLETDRSTVGHIKSFEDMVGVSRHIWQEEEGLMKRGLINLKLPQLN